MGRPHRTCSIGGGFLPLFPIPRSDPNKLLGTRERVLARYTRSRIFVESPTRFVLSQVCSLPSHHALPSPTESSGVGALAGHLVLVWFGAGLRPAPSVVVWALRAHQALPFGVYLHRLYSGMEVRNLNLISFRVGW